MSTLLSCSKLTSYVEYPTTGTHAVNKLLDFLTLVTEEDDIDTLAYIGHVETLKNVARYIMRYSDTPTYTAASTHTHYGRRQCGPTLTRR